MITPKVIKTTVNTLLQEKFPNIDVIAQEIEKGFKQPSFTVRLEDVKIEALDESIEMSLTVKTYYFPILENPDAPDPPDPSIDVADKMFEISCLFGNKLYVEDRALNVIDPSAKEIGGVLVHEFDLSFEQYDEENDVEAQVLLMKNLHLNIESE